MLLMLDARAERSSSLPCAEVGTQGEGGRGVVTVCGPGSQAGPAGSANAGCAGDALGGFSACRGRRLISTTEV